MSVDLDAIRARAEAVEVEFVLSLRCLALELPKSVYDDFAGKARAYMALRVVLLAEIERLRTREVELVDLLERWLEVSASTTTTATAVVSEKDR